MKSFTVRAESASRGAANELRRSPGSRRGPKRKIVPIPSASAAKTADEDEDEDGGLEYERDFRAEAPRGGGRSASVTSATARAKADATHVPFVAPRLAIGIASDVLERLSRGPEDGFRDVADFARKLGSSNDVLGDIQRRTEEEIDRLEAIGVKATAPVREMVKGTLPEEVYEKYLAPAVEYAEREGSTERARGEGEGEGVSHDDEFNDDAVNAAADAVAAAMAGMDVGETDAASASASASASAAKAEPSAEENFENMAADAIMSSSTMSASYTAPETTYGAQAPDVPKRAPPPVPVPVEPVAATPAASTPASTEAFDKTVGYWRKISAECPDEEPLMDIMDMNVVFRQAAGLLNYLRVSRPTPTSWCVASNAGIISIEESYPIDGTATATPRRDLRSGDQTGVVSADADVVDPLHRLVRPSRRSPDGNLPRRRRRRARPRRARHPRRRRRVDRRLSLRARVAARRAPPRDNIIVLSPVNYAPNPRVRDSSDPPRDARAQAGHHARRGFRSSWAKRPLNAQKTTQRA